MTASYTKLKSGEWGIRVEGGTPKSGERITVVKKSGETKTETIAKVVWSGNGVVLCAIQTQEKVASYQPKAGRREYDCDDFCQGCRRCM